MFYAYLSFFVAKMFCSNFLCKYAEKSSIDRDSCTCQLLLLIVCCTSADRHVCSNYKSMNRKLNMFLLITCLQGSGFEGKRGIGGLVIKVLGWG